MIIDCIEVGAFAENCYLLACDESHEGVVVDPGDEIPRILRKIAERALQMKYILLTHGHLDHVKEVSAIKAELGVPVLMHESDQFLLDNLPQQAAAFGLTTAGIPQVDKYLLEGDQVSFGQITLSVLHTPGHSPGSVSFVGEDMAVVGDVLFAGSIGRTDLPGGSFPVLIETIKSKLFPLADHTRIFPGHGPPTSIGHERKHNPFLTS